MRPTAPKSAPRAGATCAATATGGPDGTLAAPDEGTETTLTVGSGPDLAIVPVADIEAGRPTAPAGPTASRR
ncbi:hypothetical protein [Streptomyces aurantiacus]|uniref:Uncharacterized protein n=1 Tax=Streptomyces aurantiacus TaxID=47760 RepID=A0A7G1NRS1_9ACTN|nr:hypothetical protein GCM10017557_00200 [Streptomyces aurantiacus]